VIIQFFDSGTYNPFNLYIIQNSLKMIVNQSIIADIKQIILQSRDHAIRAVDHQRTLMYWHIGKRIFEEEQEGKDRAD